jgi:hydrogenase maturation protein HypF
MNKSRWLINITGTVQGVGFRPFVYRKATELDLTGSVRNTPEGVAIEAQGELGKLNTFIAELQANLPPLAEIRALEYEAIEQRTEASFNIDTSSQTGTITPTISPDIATCDECVSELMNSRDRRHHYPFTNCTNCGPRYTIIEGFPYDRPKTSMKIFDMCPDCTAEYGEPSNRRFHAQPNACPTCGPRIDIVESYSQSLLPSRSFAKDPVQRTLETMRAGGIVAIKGLGGFHLACDATNEKAVRHLREKKHRDLKPFAIMVRDLEAVRKICYVSNAEEKLLSSPRKPIVLLKKKSESPIAESVAPDNKYLGVMLPYTPLHHLLFSDQSTNLVMTSANFSDEPIIKDEVEARKKLGKIADLFLTHNRPIYMRTDDSVVRSTVSGPMIMRRARGYVPQPIEMPFHGHRVLALGGDIKNVFCLTNGTDAYLSQHIGDLQNPEAHGHFEHTVKHLSALLSIKPEVIAHDLHPNYFSTWSSRTLALSFEHTNIRFHGVQHHHAHIASCMAEHGLQNQKVIGLALDGAGFGPDGTIWGGEILRADYQGYERIGRIKPMPQPGGGAAAREPWRMALACLSKKDAERIRSLSSISSSDKSLIYEAMEKQINVPMTSSMGRLFDAVSAILGLVLKNAYEGHAAMVLEQAADETIEYSYVYNIDDGSNGILELDFTPTIEQIVKDTVQLAKPSIISAKFHNTVIDAFVEAVSKVSEGEPVVLSGGCMQNIWLSRGLTKSLEAKGYKVYTHHLVPPNDGGLALGQAAIASCV